MIWLVTHIWTFLALAALFGLILGWALRGIRVSGGARRAMVERDIALTELSQVRGELDGLYTAQRSQTGSDGAPDAEMQAQLQAREAQIGQLQGDLSAALAQVESVKADGEKKLLAATAAATAATAAGAALITDGKDRTARLDANLNPANASVEWRNRYLESRVRTLEAHAETAEPEAHMPVVEDQSDRLEALEADNHRLNEQLTERDEQLSEAKAQIETVQQEKQVAVDELAAGAVGAVLGAGTMAVASEPEVDPVESVEFEKLAWKNDYLKRRLTYLETYGLAERASPEAASVQEPEDETAEANGTAQVSAVTEELAQTAPEGDAPSEDTSEIEQELARLRWRNRYLEGRLAYIDGDKAPEDPDSTMVADAASQTSAAEALLAQLEKSDDQDAS